MSEKLDISSTDLFGSIGFDATRIASAINQFAVGGPQPDAAVMVLIIKSMLAKAEAIEKFRGVLEKNDGL